MFIVFYGMVVKKYRACVKVCVFIFMKRNNHLIRASWQRVSGFPELVESLKGSSVNDVIKFVYIC